jgi:sodium/bile acid cotransporter 7
MTDRGSVLLMVYTAFSAATVGGIWHQLTPGVFAILAAVDAALLALMLAATTLIARRLRFSRPDEIAIVFCGSKKSLISGIAMANVMFAGPALSLIVLPLMIFHQIQLMACAALAHRYARTRTLASESRGLSRPAARERETAGSAQTRFIVATNGGRSA